MQIAEVPAAETGLGGRTIVQTMKVTALPTDQKHPVGGKPRVWGGT